MTEKEGDTKKGYQCSQESPFLWFGERLRENIKKTPSGKSRVTTCTLLARTDRATMPTGKEPIANVMYRPRLHISFQNETLF